ncbi:MAG TPA: class I SAM-dependent methyltransferase family protein [Candidatus Paceibacterota bacterium]|jgi:hypothetical protein|nr:hypothetical protein [Parcubacteria group bacterium]MDP6119687.1 class I SAM-dependent methyltransferase family protein [Candidatus Paceibacterota bacterium]HJN62785.1 class I SAM-dependent methyltransferase family protein [Candidatus Paceibacterota bacterium]|tara:strand:- start:22135 stop:23025 length:891 start_codon:yes stop_codon:yes gene_type:complete
MLEKTLYIDNDPSIDYERLSPIRKFSDIFFITFLNLLPSGFSRFIKKSNNYAKDVLEHRTTHRALEVLYNHGFPTENKSALQKFFLKIWFNLHNSKAVRNRLKLVRKEIIKFINQIDKRDDDIKILSIASGSSRAIFEALSKIDPNENRVSVTFLDRSTKALDYSKDLKEKVIDFENSWKFHWIKDTVSNLDVHVNQRNSLDLVEIVGLFDYFNNKKVLEVLSNVYKLMSPKGTLITANIADNKERKFITDVVGWSMIYKEPTEMFDLVTRAGFDKDKIKIVYEPLEIHFVIVAQK